jgi:threonine/homoserine/homoserine lactone efflux protein
VTAGSIRSTRRLFAQGILVNALNPKSAVFFLAFLPPFVDPTQGPVWTQTLTLGLLFVLIAGLTNTGYALAASTLRSWLRQRPWFAPAQRFVSAGVYISLDALVATTPTRD